MKQWTVREARALLKMNGFRQVRRKGSHEIYTNGDKTIALPVVTLRSVVMNRLVKENGLKEGV